MHKYHTLFYTINHQFYNKIKLLALCLFTNTTNAACFLVQCSMLTVNKTEFDLFGLFFRLKVWDVTMQDLCSGSTTLDPFRAVVFVGGFSYADVLGSAKGENHTIACCSTLTYHC